MQDPQTVQAMLGKDDIELKQPDSAAGDDSTGARNDKSGDDSNAQSNRAVNGGINNGARTPVNANGNTAFLAGLVLGSPEFQRR